MPIGYVVAMTLVTLFAHFAAFAPRRPGPRGSIRLLIGPVINELPFIELYWVVASTLLAMAQGDLTTPLGFVGFGVGAVATGELGVVIWRGLRAGPVVEGALREGLGAGWRSALEAPVEARLRRRPPLARILFRPFFPRRRDVERVADIRYGTAGWRNMLDVYRHRSHPEGAPTLIYLHGGGFYSGRKDREARPLLYRLASQGWVCVSANYRLLSHARFPAPFIDVKRVIAWVRAHGHEYGADPSVLFVAGSSSGGHLACMAALTPNAPVFQPGFEETDTSVTAAISLYGYYGPAMDEHDFHAPAGAEGQPPSTPAAYVRPQAPPFFLAHGDNDAFVPVDSARTFARELRAESESPVVYAELPGGQQSFDLFHSLRFEAVVDGVEAFAAWVRATRKSKRTDPQGS